MKPIDIIRIEKVQKNDTKTDPKTVPWWANIEQQEQQEIEQMHDEIIRLCKEIEKVWMNDQIQEKRLLKEWVNAEENRLFRTAARKRYLNDQRKATLSEFKKNKEQYIELKKQNVEQFILDLLTEEAEKLVKTLRGYEFALDVLENRKKADITPEMIERAREYQLENILDVDKNGRALCVVHEDSRPSMDCRGNWAYCYACGYHGDAIDVYMKKLGCGFKEAVTALSGGV